MQRIEESVNPNPPDAGQGLETTQPERHARAHVRVLIIAPDMMTGEFLTSTLTQADNHFKVRVLVGNAAAATHELETLSPHIALVSEELQDGPQEGFKVLQLLHRSRPHTAVVMLLKRSNPANVIAAFRSGARGIFYRTHSLKALPKCLRTVHEGQIWVGNEDLEHILDCLSRVHPSVITDADGSPLLTRREQDVVRLVVDGMKNREIAQALQLTEHSVRNYLYRIFDKLGVSSRAELILYAFSRQGGNLRPRTADEVPHEVFPRAENPVIHYPRFTPNGQNEA